VGYRPALRSFKRQRGFALGVTSPCRQRARPFSAGGELATTSMQLLHYGHPLTILEIATSRITFK